MGQRKGEKKQSYTLNMALAVEHEVGGKCGIKSHQPEEIRKEGSKRTTRRGPLREKF